MSDIFFTQTNCDRCNHTLANGSRTMSWFTEECLCSYCSIEERALRKRLENKGINVSELEGCGHIPEENE